MKLFEKLKLGGLALSVAQWAADMVRKFDIGVVLAVVGKVVEIERDRRGVPGTDKLRELLGWLRESHPGVTQLSDVASFVAAVVSLMNALGVFRK